MKLSKEERIKNLEIKVEFLQNMLKGANIIDEFSGGLHIDQYTINNRRLCKQIDLIKDYLNIDIVTEPSKTIVVNRVQKE